MPRHTLVILAGGTGGHIYPAQSVCERLSAHRLIWFGRPDSMEETVASKTKVEFVPVKFRPPRLSLDLVISLVQMCRAGWQFHKYYYQHQPDAVIGFGAYFTLPGALVAWIKGIPLLIHEQNSVPGLANRLLARFADKALDAYPAAFGKSSKSLCLGNPVRPEHGTPRLEARLYPNRERKSNPWRLLIMGGSQGAQQINRLAAKAVHRLKPDGSCQIAVRHLCGAGWLEQTRQFYGNDLDGIDIQEYSETMADHYRWADIVICRAGALSLAELSHHALPAIVIPLPDSKSDHQYHNARYYADGGGIRVLAGKDANVKNLVNELKRGFNQPQSLRKMSRAIIGLNRHHAGAEIARVVLSCCHN